MWEQNTVQLKRTAKNTCCTVHRGKIRELKPAMQLSSRRELEIV